MEVQADILFEAAAMAAKAFREHACDPGPGHKLKIEVKGPAIKHEVMVPTVRRRARRMVRPVRTCPDIGP